MTRKTAKKKPPSARKPVTRKRVSSTAAKNKEETLKKSANIPTRKNQNKTRPTEISAEKFIRSIENETRRDDALFLLHWLQTLTGLEPHMWGSSIIGYGRYHYRYSSGREGDYLMTGFSPRKSALVLYIMPGYLNLQDKLKRLGKHKVGKSCLYINKLSDVDMQVLAEIVTYGIDFLKKDYDTYPE